MVAAHQLVRSPHITAEPERISLDVFLALPERKPALEFEDGRVTPKVSPKARHSTLQKRLSEWFDDFGGDGQPSWPIQSCE